MDPVTDDLNWSMFSGDLADGIVVSILDSFALELPVLDFATVQSTLEGLDNRSPQPKDQSKVQQSSHQAKDELQVQRILEKQEYFQDIVNLNQSEVKKSQGKKIEVRETSENDIVDKSSKQTGQIVEKRLVQSNTAGKSTGKVLDPCSPLATPREDKKQQGAVNSSESSVFQIEGKSNKRGKTNYKALGQVESSILSNVEIKQVKVAAAQARSCSFELNTIGKTFHEDEYNSDAPFTTTNTTPQEEFHSIKNVVSTDKSNATENEIPIKCSLTGEPKEQENNEENSETTFTSSSEASQI